MSSGFQPETVPELSRYIEYMFAGMREHINSVSDRLDKMDVVPRDQHREDIARVRNEIAELEKDFDDYRSRQTNLIKWFIGSLILPGVGVIISVYTVLNGG